MLRFPDASHWITATDFFLFERICSVFCAIWQSRTPFSQQVNGHAPFFRTIFSVFGDIERICSVFYAVFEQFSSSKVGGLNRSEWVDMLRFRHMVTEHGEYTFRKAIFNYSPADRDCDVRIDIAEENNGEIWDDPEMISLHVSLNKNGYAEYVNEIEDDDIEEWEFEYNSNGQLIKMVRSEGGSETTTVTYQEGDITKVERKSKFDDSSTSSTIEYGTEKIENKGGVMLFDEMLCIDRRKVLQYYS